MTKFYRSHGFTLVELLVVISIIAMLLAILMPTLSKAREQAKCVVCQNKLKQVVLCLNLYANDNQGSTVQGWTGWKKYDDAAHGGTGGLWMDSLRTYFADLNELCLCPITPRPTTLGYYPVDWDTSKVAWGEFPNVNDGSAGNWAMAGRYGSYGMNGWICNVPSEVTDSYTGGIINKQNAPRFWRKINVPNAHQVPMIGDCAFDTGWPDYTNTIPMKKSGIGTSGSADSANMLRFALNRHRWRVNMAFMDGSIRTMKLLELWTECKWNKTYDMSFPKRYIENKGVPEWAR